MKKLLITTNVLTLIILYFSSFKSANTVNSNNQNTTCDPICTNYTLNPIAGITNATAKAMAVNYQKKQWRTLNNNQDFIDTRAVWFSLDKIKSFIGEIEALTAAGNCAPNLNLGVRIYIGTYPNVTNLDKAGIKDRTAYKEVKNSYSNHLTLFMVPTYHTTDSTQVDFDPRHMGNNLCQPTPLKDLLNTKINYSDNNLSQQTMRKLKLYNVNPSEILTNDYTLSSANKNFTNGVSLNSTPPYNSLILSGTELQNFFNPNTTARMMGTQQVINHGNTIPPDAVAGSAF